jgi:hypothetical protein
MRGAGYVARMEEVRSAFKILVGKHEGKRPLGRPRSGWEDNKRMDLEKQSEMVLTGFIWLRVRANGGIVLNLRLP